MGLSQAVVVNNSLRSHRVPQAVENEAGQTACSDVPPLAIELVAIEGLCLCTRHSEVFHLLSRQRVSEEITETIKVRRSSPKSANNLTENETYIAIFEKDANKRDAFVRLCAVESSVDAASG